MSTVAPRDSLAALLNASPELAGVLRQLGWTGAAGGTDSLRDVCRLLELDPGTTARVLEAVANALHPRHAATPELLPLAELCGQALGPAHRSLHGRLGHLDALVARLDDSTQPLPAGARMLQEGYVTLRTRLVAHLQEETDRLAATLRPRPEAGAGGREGEARTDGGTPRWCRDHRTLDEDLEALISLSEACTAHAPGCDGFGDLHRALCALEADLQEQIYIEEHIVFPRVRAAVGQG